jgi:hypothetical protein
VKRIQRRRTKGWRMPEGAVYVGRPSPWGNKHRVGDIVDAPFVWLLPSWDDADTRDNLTRMTPALAVEAFRAEVAGWNHDYRTRWIEPLRGRDLACWCPLDQPCHADVLLELVA